ncbi:gliding motility-associated C-terminal domain-containing protein [Gillisia sp. M10.2A]|uniref:Gliding motility-associated C-terminal domain-containing protein n=1 Tax=Gillisia lutea TaxID=2909668 RepID=A0ABS9EIS7_9FLAO|nr:gliding motility-associated C-terminal domain-containing protein [Gillisia lutea]MCF4102247.1 gliding motility-associated C-terminal domain-containing protein [Gillisia lutea]
MQNFTLGKKGIAMLLFTFILLIGTLPSYGQNCPSLTDPTPDDFCYLQTVQDLTAETGATTTSGEVAWYRTETSANAIPNTELLRTGNYYAGNSDGTCTSRTLVNVTVDDIGAPVSQFGNFYEPCEYSTTDVSIVQDLIDNINSTVVGAEVQIFDEEFGNSPLFPLTPLVEGTSYFAGQINPSTGCPSSRIAIRYDPILATAPTGDAAQTFCDGATVSDLEATGINRWYSTSDSYPALNGSTPLIDGETYFASQIVNRTNSTLPPCESTARFAVTVSLNPTTPTESSQEFCESIGEGNNFRRPSVADLAPEGGIFYDEEDSTTPLDPSTLLVDGEDYFLRDDNTCAQNRITVTISDAPNSGSTTFTTTCENDEAFNLADRLEPSILGPADSDGIFSPALSTGTQIFNPADYAPGEYRFSYVTGSTTSCPNDSAFITVTVQEAPNAGEDGSVTLNITDAPVNLFDYLEGTPTAGGTFAPGNANGSFDPSTQSGGEYVYTVSNANCSSSASVFVTILDEQECPIVLETSQEFCESIGTGNNFNLPRVENLSPSGATWYIDATSTTPVDPNTPLQDGDIYYAGNSSSTCPDRTAVTVTISDAPNSGATTFTTACENDGAFNLVDRLNPSILGAADRDGVFSPALSTGTQIFNPADYAPGEYRFSYVTGSTTSCPNDSAFITVTVQEAPNAGEDGSVTLNITDAPVNLFDYLEGTPTAGGTFAPGNANGSFDPSTQSGGEYVYTVSNANCSSSASVFVTILDEQECPIVLETSQEFCESIGTGNNFNLPRVENLSPSGATWYIDATSTTPVDPNTPLQDGDIYYAGNSSSTCPDRTAVTVTISDTPNSGATTFTTACENGEAFNLVDRLNPSILGAADRDGVFSPALSTGTQIFNPEDYAPGQYRFRYITGSTTSCPNDEAFITVTIQESPNAGPDTNLNICSAAIPGIIANPSQFMDLLPEGVDTNGTFSPSLEVLLVQFQNNPLGTYSTTYTVSNGNCTDSAELQLSITPSPNAGQNGSVTVSRSDAPFNLFSELNGTPTTGGTWSPGNTDGSFNPATDDAGIYTYTISQGGCTSTSTVTVTIVNDPVCPVVDDTTQEFCESISDINGNNPRRPRVSDLLPTGATWYATADATTPLAATTILVNDEDYYAGNSDATCPTRGRVVVTIDESANAGATTIINVCADDEPFDVVPLINESLLGAADAGGFFTPALANGTIFNPAVDQARVYTYNVLSANSCPDDSTQITINILQNVDANAGENFSVSYCTSDAEINLADLLAEDVTPGGSFTGYSNGPTFNPTVAGSGVFEFTYTVGEDLPCVEGSASANITITVTDKPEAPVADANQSFCFGNTPTVADLVASGDNIVFYTNEDLSTVANATDALINGQMYYAVSTSGNTCGSSATVITVTINDSVAPTLSFEGDEFCRGDNPTVQDLITNLNGDAIQIYAASSGGTALGTNISLQNGVTYYASSTDSTVGCESTERLPVTVSVAFCGIPEGFSPNGDEINDEFVIPAIRDDYPNFTFEVYNRWGKMVFKGNAGTPDWDGISNQNGTLGDKVLPVGVYFYILKYNDGQTEPVQGKLYLSR